MRNEVLFYQQWLIAIAVNNGFILSRGHHG